MKKVICLISLVSLLTACGGGGGNSGGGSGVVSSAQKEFSMRANKTELTINEINGDSAEITIDGSDVSLTVKSDDPNVFATMNGKTLDVSPVAETNKESINLTITGSREGVTKTISIAVKIINLAANNLLLHSEWIESSKQSMFNFTEEEKLLLTTTDLGFKAGLLSKKDIELITSEFSKASKDESAVMEQAVIAIKTTANEYRSGAIGSSDFKNKIAVEASMLNNSILKVFEILNRTTALIQIAPKIEPINISDMKTEHPYSQFKGNTNIGHYDQDFWIYNEQFKALDAIFSAETCAIN